MAFPKEKGAEEKPTVKEVLEKEEKRVIEKAELEKAAPPQSVTRPIEEIQAEQDKEQREKLQSLSKVLGIDKQNEEIDGIKTSISLIGEKIGEIATAISQQNSVINSLTQNGATPAAGSDDTAGIEKLEALGRILESPLGKIIEKKFLGGETPQAPPQLIDQNWLNEKMKASVMENFNLGETILDSVKSSLKKKAVQNITNNALADTGLDHEPR